MRKSLLYLCAIVFIAVAVSTSEKTNAFKDFYQKGHYANNVKVNRFV